MPFLAIGAVPGCATVLPVTVAFSVPLPPNVASPICSRMPWLLYWRIWLFVTATVWLPPPREVRLIPEPCAEPELATPVTPITFPLIVQENVQMEGSYYTYKADPSAPPK